MTTSLYPAPDLFPSDTLFPGAPISVNNGFGIFSLIEASIGDLVLTNVDDQGVLWIANTLTGWWESTASTLQLTQKSRGPGAWPGPRQLQPRSISVSGTVIAPTMSALLDANDRLNSAVTLDAFLFTVAEAGQTRTCIAYRQDQPLWSRINDLTASWSVQFVAADPRKFGQAVSGATGLPSFSGTGLTVPLTVPFVMNSTVVSGAVTLTNPGNFTGPVVIRIDGPCNGPVVTHVGTGLQVKFASSLVLNVGEYLIVDMEGQTALAQGQSSRNPFITARGWSGFEPGANTWRMDSISYDPAARFTVTATPTWQ